MTEQYNQEKRSRKRLLCSDNFSDSVIQCGEECFSLNSVNYHRKGMLLFKIAPMPEIKSCTISFSYRDNETNIQISNLPIHLCHRNESDVGSQYGISFLVSENPSKQVTIDLARIETLLSQETEHEDRYGLFSQSSKTPQR